MTLKFFPKMEVLSSGNLQFFAFIFHDGVARRLDMFITPFDQKAAARLAHTGSAKTNARMRQVAIDKNWTLNEKYLLDENGDPLPAICEKDIFTLLEIPYLTPEER